MPSFIPAVRGSIKIEVLKNGKVIKTHETPNTLVLEAPKILLGNLIGPGLTSESDPSRFYRSDEARPIISAGGDNGPSSALSVNYIKLGYAEDPNSINPVTVSAADYLPSGFGAASSVTKLLTSATLGEYSIQFVCAFLVTAAEASRNYFEAALLCPALTPLASQGIDMPVPGTDAYNEDHQVMFAHQTHTAIQASEGSTLRYTWTIAMQEPSDP